eukprot:scaffold3776_cov166-Ochromonas_danica.AAC.15
MMRKREKMIKIDKSESFINYPGQSRNETENTAAVFSHSVQTTITTHTLDTGYTPLHSCRCLADDGASLPVGRTSFDVLQALFDKRNDGVLEFVYTTIVRSCPSPVTRSLGTSRKINAVCLNLETIRPPWVKQHTLQYSFRPEWNSPEVVHGMLSVLAEAMSYRCEPGRAEVKIWLKWQTTIRKQDCYPTANSLFRAVLKNKNSQLHLLDLSFNLIQCQHEEMLTLLASYRMEMYRNLELNKWILILDFSHNQIVKGFDAIGHAVDCHIA